MRRRSIVVAVLIVLVAGTCGGGGGGATPVSTSGPPPSTGASTILFHETTVGGSSLLGVAPDGTRPRLVADPTHDGGVSPDGRSMAFVKTTPRPPTTAFEVLDLTTKKERTLRTIEGVWDLYAPPVWSPGGASFAVALHQMDAAPGPSTQAVHVLTADGRADQVVGPYRFALGWSPDGRRLALSSMDGTVVVDADGSNPHRVVDQGVMSAAWSPDSTRLAFSAGDPTAVDVVDVASGARLASVGVGGLPVVDVVWAPSSARITVATDQNLMTIDTSTWAATTAVPNLRVAATACVAPSPDGSQVAFVGMDPMGRSSSMAVYTLSLAGGAATAVTPPGAAYAPGCPLAWNAADLPGSANIPPPVARD